MLERKHVFFLLHGKLARVHAIFCFNLSIEIFKNVRSAEQVLTHSKDPDFEYVFHIYLEW